MLYNILSNFRTFGRSKTRHRVRFIKDINSFYTEFLFMIAAKRSDKKMARWGDKKNLLTCTKKTLVHGIFLIIATKNET